MINCPACSPFLKKGINGHLTALCLAEASIHPLPPFDSGAYAHLQVVTAEGPCFCIVPCRSAPFFLWLRCRTLPSPRGGLVAFAICLCLRAGLRGKKKQPGPGFENRPKNYSQKKKPRTVPLLCKKKERGSGRIYSCIRARTRVHAELLAFDPRAFSSLLTREHSIWFYARHRSFVGLTYFCLLCRISLSSWCWLESFMYWDCRPLDPCT